MRKDYISWDQYFMGIALLSAERSKDYETQVGSCIVNPNKRIVGIGYNGLPIGCDDKEYPWTREGKWLNTKYPYVVHAEANAILNATTNLEGCTIYTTLFPCHECAKLIIQSGIKEVVYYDNKYDNTDSIIASKKMFQSSNVAYRLFNDIKIDITSR